MVKSVQPCMRSPKNDNANWLLKLPVLAVYLLFFTVQIFFNIDISSHSLTTPHNTVYAGSFLKKHPETVKQRDAKTLFREKIRLNKRFEPSSVPCNIARLATSPVQYAEPLIIGLFQCNFYSSAPLTACSLRGPPVVA